MAIKNSINENSKEITKNKIEEDLNEIIKKIDIKPEMYIKKNYLEIIDNKKIYIKKHLINEKEIFFKNLKILYSRYELFQLFLSDLIFENEMNKSEYNIILKKVLKIHENLFDRGLKNLLGYLDINKSYDISKNIKPKLFNNFEKNKKCNAQKIERKKNLKNFKNPKKIFSWILFKYFPILTWLQEYNINNFLKDDIISGITVGVMLIAQGMAYAKLAGLPPEYGLYSSGIPLFIYPLFGSSKHLGFGPVAIVSLLVSQITLSTNSAGHEYSTSEKITFSLLMAFSVGIVQISMGIVQIGFIVNFISHPVIAGFTTAAAFVIILSQIQHLLGFSVQKSHYPLFTLISYLININKFKWQPFFFGSANIFCLQMVKLINKNYKLELPGPILCVILSILITQTFKLNRFGITIQNKIPKGFPKIRGPIFNEFTKVAPVVLTISFINFLETIAIASKIGEIHGYKIVPDQELIGSGMTNLCGSFLSAFPMAGSFSRTAVLSQVGGKTQIAGLTTGIVIVLTYLFFTPLFTFLPNVTLASIILVSVINLIDYKEASNLLKIRFLDFFAFMISFISTFFIGVEWGIAIAIGVSLLIVLWFSINPTVSILGRIPGTVVYKDLKWYKDCIYTPGGILLRMDAPLFFVNSSVLRKKLKEKEDEYKNCNPVNLFYTLIDCRGMADIDSTGLELLNEIKEKFKKRKIFFGLANVNERVRKLLNKIDFENGSYHSMFFLRIHDGVEAAIKWKLLEIKNLSNNL